VHSVSGVNGDTQIKKDVFRAFGTHGRKRNSYIILGGRSEGRRSFGISKREWNILTKIFSKMDGTMFSV